MPVQRQVEEVPDEEQADDDARSTASCGWRSWRRCSRAWTGTSCARAVRLMTREGVGGVDVQREGGDQPDAHEPQEHRAGQDRHEELAEELAVVVEVLGPEVHLEVADHVDEHEAHQQDAGDRHHVLLADRRAVELDGERCLAASLRNPGLRNDHVRRGRCGQIRRGACCGCHGIDATSACRTGRNQSGVSWRVRSAWR